jgi:hypothetical protein
MMAFQSKTVSAMAAAGSKNRAARPEYGFQSCLLINVFTFAFRQFRARTPAAFSSKHSLYKLRRESRGKTAMSGEKNRSGRPGVTQAAITESPGGHP